MAKATSPASGQPYGIRRVCQAWGVPRSSFYAAQTPTSDSASPAPPPVRRGPKPAVTDETLLAAIRRDLERSPWTGEGHRKVWAAAWREFVANCPAGVLTATAGRWRPPAARTSDEVRRPAGLSRPDRR